VSQFSEFCRLTLCVAAERVFVVVVVVVVVVISLRLSPETFGYTLVRKKLVLIVV
jgi:hypothetical protein